MKKLQAHLKAVSKELGKITKKIEQVAAQVAKHAKVKPAPKKKAVKKAAAKKVNKAAAKKVKKAAPKKATAKKATAKKATLKKAAPKKATKKLTVLESVYDVVSRARGGATIAQLKQKTGLNPRQLSNALYKLSTRGKIVAKSRGVYVKK